MDTMNHRPEVRSFESVKRKKQWQMLACQSPRENWHSAAATQKDVVPAVRSLWPQRAVMLNFSFQKAERM